MTKKIHKKHEKEERNRSPVKRTLPRRLLRWKRILDLSTTHETLKDYAQRYRYDGKKLGAGKKKADKLENLYFAQKTALAVQMQATRDFNDKFKEADAAIMHLVETARAAFGDDSSACLLLGLKGRRSKVFAQWLMDNNYFYNQLFANPDILEQMARHGAYRQVIQAGKRQLKEAKAADVLKQKAKADKQRATEQRDKAEKDLSQWMEGYLTIMRTVLRKEPQLKKML